jgi:hypothetical protein
MFSLIGVRLNSEAVINGNYIFRLSNYYEKSIGSAETVQRQEGLNNRKFNYKGTYKAICHHRYPNFHKDIKSIFKVYFQ